MIIITKLEAVPFAQANYARQPLNLEDPAGVLKANIYDWSDRSLQAASDPAPGNTDYEKVASFAMGPASRIDLLVKAPDWDSKGEVKLDPVTKEEYQEHVLLSSKLWSTKPKKQNTTTTDPEAPRKDAGVELLTLRVVRNKKGGARGNLSDVKLPALPEWLKDIEPEPAKRRTFAFSMERGPTINNKKHDHQVLSFSRLPDPWP